VGKGDLVHRVSRGCSEEESDAVVENRGSDHLSGYTHRGNRGVREPSSVQSIGQKGVIRVKVKRLGEGRSEISAQSRAGREELKTAGQPGGKDTGG